MTTCPHCGGHPEGKMLVCGTRDGQRFSELREHICSTCKGTGEVPAELAALIEDRQAMRGARIRRGETQAEAGARLGMTGAEYSRWERGR